MTTTISTTTASPTSTTSNDDTERPPPPVSLVIETSMLLVIVPEIVADVSEVFSAASPVTCVIGPGKVTLTLMEPIDASPRSAAASDPSVPLWPSLTMRKTIESPSLTMVQIPPASVNVSSVKLQEYTYPVSDSEASQLPSAPRPVSERSPSVSCELKVSRSEMPRKPAASFCSSKLSVPLPWASELIVTSASTLMQPVSARAATMPAAASPATRVVRRGRDVADSMAFLLEGGSVLSS